MVDSKGGKWERAYVIAFDFITSCVEMRKINKVPKGLHGFKTSSV